MIKTEKAYKIIWKLLLVGTVLAALKSILISLQMDEDYAISLSYRLLHGDRLLTQVWDPHQTSAFLIQFLIWIYETVFHTTTYMVIFIRFVGVCIHGLVTWRLYRYLKTVASPEESRLLALLFFNLSPKTYVMPEFSNMMVWGITMLLLAMSGFGLVPKEKRIAAQVEIGLWLVLLVLSYPSCVLLFFFVLGLYLYQGKRNQKSEWKSILVVTLTCGLCAAAYLAYLLSYMSISQLFTNVKNMLASCGSHDATLLSRLVVYGKDALYLVLITMAYVLVSTLVYLLFSRKKLADRTKEEKQITWLYLFFFVALGEQILHWILMLWDYEYSYPYAYYFALLAVGGVIAWRACKMKGEGIGDTAKIWLIGMLVLYIAILLLTNLTLFTSVKYLMPGVVICILLLLLHTKQQTSGIYQHLAMPLLLLWCFTAIFVKGWVYTDDEGAMRNVTSIGNIISVGPAKGIITDYMQGYMQENIYEELQQYTQPGDSLVVYDNHTLCYLYRDVKVGSYTTICTPTYDENIFTYWEQNPDKYPDVIAVRCWFGELKWDPKWDENEWMLNWIQNEYGADEVADGKYLRYFIRRR